MFLPWRHTQCHGEVRPCRARLKRGFPSLAAQARALELRGRPDSELLSLATQTSACEVRVCLASPAILVGFLGEDASKPHETHPNRTSSTYLDPPGRTRPLVLTRPRRAFSELRTISSNKPIIILKERQVTRPAPRPRASPALQKKPVPANQPSGPREGAAPPGQSIP